MASAMVFPFDEDAKFFLLIEAQIKYRRGPTRKESMNKRLIAEFAGVNGDQDIDLDDIDMPRWGFRGFAELACHPGNRWGFQLIG
jgi:hypothetical protein